MTNRRIANGPAIRAWRENRGMSLRNLAGLTECHYSTLGRIEKGQRPASAKLIRLIAQSLDVSDDVLTMVAENDSAAA